MSSMAQQHQIVHTICLQTRDAVSRSEGSFTWEVPGEHARAVKVQLGSLEFPMKQWTIESQWNQLYLCEGVRLPPNARTLQVRVTSQTLLNDVVDATITLPTRNNAIARWRIDVDQKLIVATCAQPHGLWSADGSHSLVPHVWWGVHGACLVASPFGTLPLRGEPLVRFSSTEFAIALTSSRANQLRTGENDASPRAGYLHIPDAPSPAALAAVLDVASRGVHGTISMRWRYVPREDRVSLTLQSRVGSYSVLIRRSRLAQMLGLGHDDRRAVVHSSDGPPADVPTEPCARLWARAAIAPGTYGPSTRPMCTGAPLRLSSELELALNRLHFALPERVAQGAMTSHHLVFVGPCGATLLCPVPAGRYTPLSLCALLERGMTQLAQATTPGVEFSVAYQNGRFLFSCEVRDGGAVHPAPFALAFNHPSQFEPERLGFSPLLLSGSASYASTRECVVPRLDDGQAAMAEEEGVSGWRGCGNVYRVSDIGNQDRLSVHATPSYALTGIIERYDAKTATLTLRTHVGQLPFAHGLAPEEVVQVVPARTVEVFVPDAPVADGGDDDEARMKAADEAAAQAQDEAAAAAGDGDAAARVEARASTSRSRSIGEAVWSGIQVKPCPLAPSWARLAVVLPTSDAASRDSRAGPLVGSVATLQLRVRASPELADCVGQALTIAPLVAPFNFSFGTLPRSIPNELVGTERGATLYGVDGSMPVVHDGDPRAGVPPQVLRMPPLEFPYVTSLDHPDYVLVYLDEGKRSTIVTHKNGPSISHPLAKICLYPQFREERSLPRETTLISGESLNRFTIRFTTPQGRPYAFHGAEFSLSLNLVTVGE